MEMKGLLVRPQPLSKGRVWAVMTVAIIADALQWLFVMIPWVDSAIDIGAAIFTISILGFHPLLLPTFILELVPVADLLPTWTGCVALVLALRKRSESLNEPPKIIVHPPPLEEPGD